MSFQQNNFFATCDDQKRQCYSLPPKVNGKICGFLTLKVGRIVWSMNSYKNVVLTVAWWGESKPLSLRPCIIDGNKFGRMGNEIIYEIRTDPKTFEDYLRDCESLEFNVINEEVNESIGKISVPDLMLITSENRYGGCFSVIDVKGFTAGDICVTFDLFFLRKYSLKEMRYHQNNGKVGMHPYTKKEHFCNSMSVVLNKKKKDQISDVQNEEEFSVANSKSLFTCLSCGDDKDDKALKQITSNNRSIKKADTELNPGIHKEFCAGMKEATLPDFIGGIVQHHEAIKQINSMRINILSLSLNRTVVHQENGNLKNFRSNCNSMCQHIVLPSKPAYFVEYEIPGLLNITANKSDISRNFCPWNRRIIRFCSRKQMGSEIYFGQSSVHHLPRRKGCWLENFKDLKIVMKVFLRNSNQRVPLQIGKAALEMCSVMSSESLSFSSESPVFSSVQMPHSFCIGKLRTKIELGRDSKYFGKEFFKITVNRGSDSVKEWGTKKSEVQENSEEVFKDLYVSEKQQQEQNKENMPEPEMKQQYVEKPLLLYGLIYISSGRGFNVMNSYVVSKSFWKEDIAISNICWETSVPNYSLRELIPVLLSAEFLERCHNNFLIVEAWERKPVAQEDKLIGIAKLPLNQFFIAFRNPLLTEQLIQAKYPVVGVDGWVNVFNPVTRVQAGQLHAVLCLGTEDQIQLFERVRGIMETAYVLTRMQTSNSMHYDFSSVAPKPKNFTEASVTQCQLNSDPKQVVSPSKSVHGGNIDESPKEVPLNVHQQNKINQENANSIKNNNKNLTNPPEALLTKQHDTSFVLNMNAKPNGLQQNVDENKSTRKYGSYELSQSAYHEKFAEHILDTDFDTDISVVENIISSELDKDKQQSNLSVTKVVDDIETCTVKNQQCQTDLFVLDLQHYGPDFLTKHKNIEPLIIKLSSRGLEIIEMNECNANAEILDTKDCHSNSVKKEADKTQNQLQLTKDFTCFKQHDPQSLSSSSTGEATYAFGFSGDKEHNMLNSGDDTVAHDNRGDSVSKFSTENYNSAKQNKDGVGNDHKMKSVGDTERESKTNMCNSDQNSVKHQRTSAANGTTNSKRLDSHLTCNMVEFTVNTDQAHACNNYFIAEDGEEDHSGDFSANQSKSARNTGSNNLLMGNYGLSKHAVESNTSDQSSFSSKKKHAFGNTVDSSNNGKQEVPLGKNETNHQLAKDHNHFKNIETPTEVSDNAELPSYAHITPEYSVVSASNNFCARIEVDEALNLSLHESDEAGRNVYVSFHLNHGCAKVIIDGEIQLKTGLLFTPVVACNGNPVWNWHCEAWLPSDLLTDRSKQLIMKIWQKNNRSDAADPLADILLGLASIDLTVVMLGMPWVCDWFSIVNFTGSCIGQIKVSVKPQENLDRFRPSRINTLPDSSATKSVIETSILQNTSYPQTVNSGVERSEHYHANVQKINCHLPKRPQDTKMCFVKHTKTASKASSADIKALKHEKNIPLEWDLDFPEDATTLLTRALWQKLSELDEITKRLKRRLLTVTSERVLPASLVWKQEEAYCEKSDQKQNSSASAKNCAQISTEAKVDSSKDGSYNVTHTSLHRNCYCTHSGTTSQFQHNENACQLKHLDHLSNKMNFSKLSKTLDNETSPEQLRHHQFGNQCLQCNESNACLQMGEKDLENSTERGVYKDNDVEDFDALTDVLMETATKELDIANVFNPLLFQHLLLSNANLIQRRCQRDKCSKQENVLNLSDSQNSAEIMFKCDKTLLTVCTMKEIDDKVQDNVSCSSENKSMQCSENICHSDRNSFHKMIEMDKFKKLGSHIISEKQHSCQEKLISNNRDPENSLEISKQLAPLTDASSIAESSLNAVKTISNLEKQCKSQQCYQLKIPINGQSYQHKASVSFEKEVNERFSEEQGLSENIKTHKEEIESCSEFSSITRKQKLLQGNMKEVIEVVNTQAKNGGYDNKQNPPDMQGKRKQRSVVCRLAPLFFQKSSTKHE